MRGAILVAVFIGALSMHAQQKLGWAFLLLCLFVGFFGGVGALWVKGRIYATWHHLPKYKRTTFILAGTTIVLAAIFLFNRHKPDEGAADFAGVLTVFVVLFLWGLYSLWSRLLDAIYIRFTKR
jgi:cytochrome bd-type quinol oxidase subunit 2